MNKKHKLYLGLGFAVFSLMVLLAYWAPLSQALGLNPVHVGSALAAIGLGAVGLTKEDKDEIGTLLEGVATKHKEAIKTEIAAAMTGTLTIKEFKDHLEKAGIKEETIKNLANAVEKQGEVLRKMQANSDPGKEKTMEQLVEEKAEDIKKLQSGGRNVQNVKIVLPYTHKTQVARAAVSGSTMAMRLIEVGQIPYMGTRMSNLFRHAPVSPSSNGVIRYFDQANITRGAAMVAEGATKPESAIDWIERLLPIEKIADTIPVTKEAWADIYFVQSEIDRLLHVNLELKEDGEIWSGSGVTPHLKGVFTTATEFDGTVAPYAGSVAFANIYDLIAMLRVDIMNSKQSKYNPNVVCLNPVDVLRFKLTKDSLGRYVMPSFTTPDGNRIDGCEVVESSRVDSNTLLVGDFRYGTIYDLEGVTIEMGYINDQFVKNAMTILAEKREGLLIRNVDADAFRKVSDIDVQLAAINIV